MSTTMNHTEAQEYLELVRAFPLLSIRDDAQLDEAFKVIDRLTDIHQRSAAEDAYLDALTDLVETYENVHVHIPAVKPDAALRYLMEENGVNAEDLAASPDTAARIFGHWLRAYGTVGAVASEPEDAIKVRLFDIWPRDLWPQSRIKIQAMARHLAMLLDVPPDLREIFVKSVSRMATSPRPNGDS